MAFICCSEPVCDRRPGAQTPCELNPVIYRIYSMVQERDGLNFCFAY